jgi:hypothetical protein
MARRPSRCYLEKIRPRPDRHPCTRGRGRGGRPAVPAPSVPGEWFRHNSGVSRRGNVDLYPDVIARVAPGRSSTSRASMPVSRKTNARKVACRSGVRHGARLSSTNPVSPAKILFNGRDSRRSYVFSEWLTPALQVQKRLMRNVPEKVDAKIMHFRGQNRPSPSRRGGCTGSRNGRYNI